MKTVKTLLLALASMPLFTACIDDAEQNTYLTEDRRNEIANEDPDKVFSSAVAGMYTDMQQYVYPNMNHNYFGQKSFDYLTSLMGNDMIMTGRFAMSLYHYQCDYWGQNYTPTVNRWREYYTCIDNANKILKSIDPETTDANVLKYRAIALGMRGRAYLQLSYLYQQSYYVGDEDTKWGKGNPYDNSEAKCVPIVTEQTEGDQPLSTVKQVMDQIKSDLGTAYDIFKQIGQVKTTDPTDFDGCVAATYLARAYMITHDWDKALEYANVVTENFPPLQSKNEILQGFSSISLPDVVWGSDVTADNSTTYMSWFSQMDAYGDGYAAIGVWRAAYGPFVDKIADDDVRLKWFCCDRSTGATIDGKRYVLLRDVMKPASVNYQSVKFIGAGRNAVIANAKSIAEGNGAPGWELGDYIYLRSEEAYLMEAEILAHQGKLGEAKTALESFMRTRQPSYTYAKALTKADLIEEINFQKRVEFWGEGMEFLDNRRLNIDVDRTQDGDRNNHLASARIHYTQNDRHFRYQIPISEIENNKQISADDQN